MTALVDQAELFRSKGVPHRRLEDWKYTDLRAALDIDAVTNAGSIEVRISNASPDIEQYIHQSGRGAPDWIGPRYEEVASRGAMEAAARAFDRGGFAFRVPKGVRVERALQLDFFGHGHGQAFLFIEAGASLTLVETHHPKPGALQNISLSIFLEAGAQLTHIRKAPFMAEAVTVETVAVLQFEEAIYRAHLLNGGAKISRLEFYVRLVGEGATADLSGVSILGDQAHVDVTTRVVHWVPNTTSRQLFKNVAGGKSRAVYQGKVTVRENAIGSDSRQTAKALLLSDRAEADLKPELEILADDVKCAHGAAVGDLDADSLFYLRSRGIPESEARGLLIHAFLQEVVDGIEDEGLRGTAVEFIESGLAWAMESAS